MYEPERADAHVVRRRHGEAWTKSVQLMEPTQPLLWVQR